MKTGIFGGSFDPPHIGHISILEHCRKQFALDRIIIVPTGEPPHKKPCTAGAVHRYNMCKLAFPDYTVSDYETKKTGYCYSADMLEHFGRMSENGELYFIIGGDSLDYIDRWYQPERIFKAAKIIAADRSGSDEDSAKKRAQELGAVIYLADNPVVDVSSTEIRKLIKEDKPFEKLVGKQVFEYISENNLYR